MANPIIQLDNSTASAIVLVQLGVTVPASGNIIVTGNPDSVLVDEVVNDPQLNTFVDAGDITLTVDAVALTEEQSKAYVGYDRVLDNDSATVAPTVNADADAGYRVGSMWIDVTNDSAYVCVDATNNAAVWVSLGGDAAFGTPVSVGISNAPGAAGTHTRSDHVHAHGDQTVGSLHAVVTTSVNGFMSAADKTKLDGLVATIGETEFSSTVLATSLGTFQDAFPAQNMTVPATGTYLILFGCNIAGSAGNTINEIGIFRNSVVIADSPRLIQGNGGASLSSICHTVIALTSGDTITGVWRKNAGSGTSTVGSRRITMMLSNITP